MFRKLMLMVVVLGFSATLFGEVNPDSLPEKYTKKVIIEAKWGSGPGEFGIAKWCDPIEGPGPITVDKNGNIYIADPGNFVIHEFDEFGNFIRDFEKGKIILYFTVRNDTMYAIGKDDINDNVRRLYLIDCKKGKELFSVSLKSIGISKDDLYGYDVKMETVNGAVVFGKEDLKYEISIKNKTVKQYKYRLPTNILEKAKVLQVPFLTQDKKGNYYFGSFTIYKLSKNGSVLWHTKLPRKNYIGEYTIDKIFITEGGDIYYLYPTGKIIEKNWKIHFIPGKVQVIKWELQK